MHLCRAGRQSMQVMIALSLCFCHAQLAKTGLDLTNRRPLRVSGRWYAICEIHYGRAVRNGLRRGVPARAASGFDDRSGERAGWRYGLFARSPRGHPGLGNQAGREGECGPMRKRSGGECEQEPGTGSGFPADVPLNRRAETLPAPVPGSRADRSRTPSCPNSYRVSSAASP